MTKHHHRKHRDSDSSSDSGSDSECEYVKDFENTYKYLKNRLITDEGLQAAGSDAYASIFNVSAESLGIGSPVTFDSNQNLLNIDHVLGSGDIAIRKSGVYFVIYAVNTDQPLQLSLFVNNVYQQVTNIGKNTGATQLFAETLLNLKKNDVITLRNWISGVNPVVIPVAAGGTLIGVNAEIVLMKVAPLPEDVACLDEDMKINRKQRHFFKKLEEKMLCDPALLLNFTDTHGAFYRVSQQTLNVGDSVIFEGNNNVRGMTNAPGTGNIVVNKSGAYYFTFAVESNKASQFTVFINGIPDLTTTAGINKAAGQLILRQILMLKAGDVLSVRNYISSIGSIDTSLNAGGLAQGTQATLIVYRLGPNFSDIDPCERVNLLLQCRCADNQNRNGCKEDDREDRKSKKREMKLNCLYQQYKQFLLRDCKLMLTGSESYQTVYNTTGQTVLVEQPINYEVETVYRNAEFNSLTTQQKVCRSGLYKIVFFGFVNQSSQFTFFINGVAITNTTAGTDSGSGEVSLRQLVALKAGDILTTVNHTSGTTDGSVQLTENPGGSNVTMNASTVFYMISPWRDDWCGKDYVKGQK